MWQGDETQQMTVSVIIPTYNRAGFIAEAVQSALDQTRAPNEIIVIDDGSTDDTQHVLARFGPPVIVIERANGGEAAARNSGLRAATGDAVIFLDSDDLLVPECIERCVQTLEEHPNVGVVYTDAFLCDREGNRISRYSQELPGCRPSGMVLREFTRRNFLTVTSMVRRSCLGDITFEEGMTCCADYDFWRKLAVHCEFQYLNEPLMCYRFHESMTVSTRLHETLTAEAEVQRRIMEMPEFQTFSKQDQARAYCIHGIKRAMLGSTDLARQNFLRTIRTSPTSLSAYPLLLLSLLGKRPLQYAILKRRQLAGNRLGTKAGPLGLLEKQPARKKHTTKPTAGRIPAEALAAQGGRHG